MITVLALHACLAILPSRFPCQVAAPETTPAPQAAAPETATPTDATGLTALLLEKRDEADPELVRRLANLKNAEALDGLTRFYDAVGSRYMRRIALRGFALFGGVPELEGPALQKLTDIATLAPEPELRETAVDELADATGGRAYLAAIVASEAEDALRERALRLHVAGAQPEDVDFYLKVTGSDESKKGNKKERKEKDKDKDKAPEPLYTPPLKEIAFEGLAASRSVEELVKATESKLVLVRRRALEELAARRAPEALECAERMYDSRSERPDTRLYAAEMLLAEHGPKFAERLFKEAKRGEVPQELAFGIADMLSALDDPGLRSQVVKNLGQGQAQEKRFHLRMAVKIPDSKVDKALLELSEDKDPMVAADAVRALGLRGNPTFVPRLKKVMTESREPAVLAAAIESLIRIQGSDPVWRAALAGLVTHPVEVVRNSAVEALGRTRDPDQLAPLETALAHPDWSTRLAAAKALEELRLPAGVGALCARIGLEEGRMAVELADVLWRLTAQPFRADGAQWQRWWQGEGANFRFPTAEELQKRQRDRDLREDKQVSRSFRGVKVDSRFFGLRIASHHVAFVVDVSGSMEERLPGQEGAEKAPTRMEVARRELLACLDALEAGTRFNILPFSSTATPWKEAAVEATEETFTEAKEFITSLGALGGTNVHDGLLAAFDDPEMDTIFFLSDGEPTQGPVTDPAGIREAVKTWNQQRHVVIHTISIGDRFPLLEWLASDSGGLYRTYP